MIQVGAAASSPAQWRPARSGAGRSLVVDHASAESTQRAHTLSNLSRSARLQEDRQSCAKQVFTKHRKP